LRLTPLTDHNLAVLFTELAALLVAARTLGWAARRAGQPPVVGELVAGLVLGPSVFGQVWPRGFSWFLPAHQPVENGALLTLAQVSLVVLLVVIGADTDLRLIGHLGRAAASVSVLSLAVPMAAGAGLALVLPAGLVGARGGRGVFVLLMAGAIAISSLPVIAKIVTDLGLARRNIGQLIFAAGTVNDTFGFLLVAVATAVVTAHGSSSVGHLARVAASLAVLVLLAATVGQRMLDRQLRGVLAGGSSLIGGLTVSLVGALVVTALFQEAGVEGALGAFVFGVVLGRSRFRHEETVRVISALSSAVFAPLYFATAGLRVDVTALGRAQVLYAFLAMVAVAGVAKFLGAALGAAVARLPRREWVALGIGLNGRGALQVIIVSAGLGIGALTDAAYSDVILMSIVTSLATPPLLRWVARDWAGTSDEQDRLGHEEEMAGNLVVRGQRILIPTRGTPNSIVAAEVVGAVWPEDSEVTVLAVADRDGGAGPGRQDLEPIEAVLAPRPVEHQQAGEGDVLEEILAQARLGYGLIAVGAADEPTPGGLLSAVVDELLARSPLPTLVARRARGLSGELPGAFASALVPVTGSASSRAAEEVAFNLSRNLGTELCVTHVVTRGGEEGPGGRGPGLGMARHGGGGVVSAAAAHADQVGVRVRTLTRQGRSAGEEIVATASETGVDLIVMGATARVVDDKVFLGHTVEHVLEHATPTVVVVVLPDPAAPDPGDASA
jgi:Kef-type K+ transport system membrane component KefB/nucleotide-binding universal stress UspA family protein